MKFKFSFILLCFFMVKCLVAKDTSAFPLQLIMEEIAQTLQDDKLIDELKQEFPSCFSEKALLAEAGECFHLFGRNLEEWGAFDPAYECYQQALEIYDSLEDARALALIYRDLSVFSETTGEVYEQITYAQQGLDHLESLEADQLRGNLFLDMANGYKNALSFDRAESSFLEAERYYEKTGDQIGVAMSKYGRGDLYFQMEFDSIAEELINQGLQIFEDSSVNDYIAQSYNVLGAIHMDRDSLKARNHFLKCLFFLEGSDNRQLKFDAHVNLAMVEFRRGLPQAARKYYEMAVSLSEDSNHPSDELIMEDIRTLLEIQEQKLKMQRLLWLSISVGLLVGMMMLFYSYRKKISREQEAARKEAERKREEYQQKVEREKEEILREEARKREEARREADRQLQAEKKEREVQESIDLAAKYAMMVGEEAERDRLRKLVHHHIGSQLTAVDWNLDACITALAKEKLSIDDLKETKRMVSKAEGDSRNIEKLLEEDGIDWYQRIRTFFEELEKAPKKNCQIDFLPHDLESGLPGTKGKAVYEIVQIGISNALRHAEASKINCQLNRIENDLVIVMEDNGKGFDKNLPVEGIGLKSLKELAKFLRGKEQIDSQLGNGTTISIACPFYN